MSEKTEQATSKKKRDARQKGQVAKSPDVAPALSLLFVCIVIMFLWPTILNDLEQLYDASIKTIQMPFRQGIISIASVALDTLINIVLPIVFASMLGAIIGNFMQIGFLFSMKAATPSLNKLNPKNWFKKVFSRKGLFELIKTIIKVIVLGVVAFYTVQEFIDPILKSAPQGVYIQFKVFSELFFTLILRCVLVFAITAAVDYLIVLKMHNTELMMTKDEVKREHKDMEGDPIIKSQRRQLQMELANETTLQETRKASVLVVNPTHIAVAIRYEDETMPIPMVTGIGYGLFAQKMREIAEEENIPIMRNVDLARSLADNCVEFDFIPPELIDQVVDVLLWVNTITGDR